jgi:hypothetical protein
MGDTSIQVDKKVVELLRVGDIEAFEKVLSLN